MIGKRKMLAIVLTVSLFLFGTVSAAFATSFINHDADAPSWWDSSFYRSYAIDTDITYYTDTLDTSGFINDGVYLDFMFVYVTPWPSGGHFFGNVGWTNSTGYDVWNHTVTYLDSSGNPSGSDTYDATYAKVHYFAHLLGEPGDIFFDFGAGNQQITEWVVYSDFNQNPVPEPATMFLLGSGLVGLAGFRRKKK